MLGANSVEGNQRSPGRWQSAMARGQGTGRGTGLAGGWHGRDWHQVAWTLLSVWTPEVTPVWAQLGRQGRMPVLSNWGTRYSSRQEFTCWSWNVGCGVGLINKIRRDQPATKTWKESQSLWQVKCSNYGNRGLSEVWRSP